MRKPTHTICALAALVPPSSALPPGLTPTPRTLLPRSNATLSVCNPGIPAPGAPMPPCAHIEYIETMCWPKGPSPLHYDNHSQCMCNGSFFPEWLGCQECLFVHGLRDERESAFYGAVLSGASERLCTGTPAVPFRSLFAEVEATAERVTAGATTKVDRYPGNSDVGLYYTPSGKQGMGPVTGSAATVTMEGGLVTAEPETTSTTASRGPNSNSSRISTTESGDETEAPEPDDESGADRPCLLGAALAGCVVALL